MTLVTDNKQLLILDYLGVWGSDRFLLLVIRFKVLELLGLVIDSYLLFRFSDLFYLGLFLILDSEFFFWLQLVTVIT